jgi:serine/threonine protein kinase
MEHRIFLGRYWVPTTKSRQWWEARRTHFSITCQAEEMPSGREVVLDLVPLCSLGEEERAELQKAARAARQIRHINLPLLYEFGIEGEQFVFVVEYLKGTTLTSWVARHGPLPVPSALAIGLQVVSALRVIACHGIGSPAVHPANLMLVSGEQEEGEWPLVKMLHFFGPHRAWPLFDLSDPKLPDAAAFVSPEQLAGAPTDFRSKVYALGATLWFLISATPPALTRPPVPGRRRRQSFATDPAALAELPGLPESVKRLLGSMLARAPEGRPLDPGALEESIHGCLSEINSRRSVTPASAASSVTLTPRNEPAQWRSAGMKILATAGASALVAVGLSILTEKVSSPDSAAVSSARRAPNQSSLRSGETRSVSPDSMNFSVVPPSYESEHVQVRALQPAVAQETSSPNEAAPPAEGPGDPTVEIVTKAGRALLKKTFESSPSILITPGKNPAGSVPPGKGK